jgi:hypothetical protein
VAKAEIDGENIPGADKEIKEKKQRRQFEKFENFFRQFCPGKERFV